MSPEPTKHPPGRTLAVLAVLLSAVLALLAWPTETEAARQKVSRVPGNPEARYSEPEGLKLPVQQPPTTELGLQALGWTCAGARPLGGAPPGYILPFQGHKIITMGPGEGQWHQGASSQAIDYTEGGNANFPVVAVAPGVVVDTTVHPQFGNLLRIQHADGRLSFYAHLNSFSVSAGSSVSQGQAVGIAGTTGNSTGVHLHFEVRQGWDRNNTLSGYSIDIKGLSGTMWCPSYPPGSDSYSGYADAQAVQPAFSNLTASLGCGASFNFSYSGPATNNFHVELSTVADMSTDVYLDFGTGNARPITVSNPTKWDKYRHGARLYWRIWNGERTVVSPIQSAVVDLSSCQPGGSFSNLSASLGCNASFSFADSGSSPGFHVDLSTTPDMSWDVYLDFSTGSTSPLPVFNPGSRWDKYRNGRRLYWRVSNSARTVVSPIQSSVVNCPSLP